MEIDWLRSQIDAFSCDLAAAYQFGSSLTLDRPPNDIDVALITADGAGEPSWLRTIEIKTDLEVRFREIFGLPLSIMVLTPLEWAEISNVVVRERASLLAGPRA